MKRAPLEFKIKRGEDVDPTSFPPDFQLRGEKRWVRLTKATDPDAPQDLLKKAELQLWLGLGMFYTLKHTAKNKETALALLKDSLGLATKIQATAFMVDILHRRMQVIALKRKYTAKKTKMALALLKATIGTATSTKATALIVDILHRRMQIILGDNPSKVFQDEASRNVVMDHLSEMAAMITMPKDPEGMLLLLTSLMDTYLKLWTWYHEKPRKYASDITAMAEAIRWLGEAIRLLKPGAGTKISPVIGKRFKDTRVQFMKVCKTCPK